MSAFLTGINSATQTALDGKVAKTDLQRYGGGALAGLRAALSEGKDSIGIQVISDSTGANTTYGWPVQFGSWIGSQYPAYTIKMITWANTTGPTAYGAPQTIHTGTGGGERRIEFPGTGDAAATWMIEPATFTQPTGDFSIIVPVRFDSWPSGDVPLQARWVPSVATKMSYKWVFRSDRKLQLYYSTDGSTQKDAYFSTATTFSLGQKVWLKCDFDSDNGSGGRTIVAKVSTDGTTYSTVGTVTDSSGTGGVYTSAPADLNYETGITSGSGAIYASYITDGIDGPIVSPVLIDSWNYRSIGNSYLAGPPELWIVNASVSGWSVNNFSGNASDTNSYITPDSRWLPKYNQQLCIINLIHNSGNMRGKQLFDKYDQICAKVREQLSDVPRFVYLTANPRYGGMPPGTTTSIGQFEVQSNAHDMMRYNLFSWAPSKGAGVIDTYRAFVDYGANARADLMTDNVHPNSAGQALIATQIENAFLQGQP